MPNFLKGNPAAQPEHFCKYIHRYCNQTRLDGYDYCIRHILEDKSAPFRQCIYVNQPNKKRCTNAASKVEKSDMRALCPFHAKRALMKIKIAHTKKRPSIDGPSAFLKCLEHHCTDSIHDSSHRRDNSALERHDVSACDLSRAINLDTVCASLSDEPIENKAKVDNVDDDFAWVEKNNDYLEHAGIFTHKEVVKIARDKILRLQQLYCDELKMVYHELKEKRRNYLSEVRKSVKVENPEGFQRVSVPAPDSKKLNCLKKCHQREGVERILHHRAQQKNSDLFNIMKTQTCCLERRGVRCPEPAVVMTKYCQRHIMLDPKQVLFKRCGHGRNCRRPVIPFTSKAACPQHFYLALSRPKEEEAQPLPVSDQFLEPEPFHSMDDIASLALGASLDAILPASLFGLDQFGEPGESTDTVLSEDLLQIGLNPPADILSDSRKSEYE